MSAGTAGAAEGRVKAVPAPANRAYVIGRLEAERRQAESCFEYQRVAEIEAQIRSLSAGTARSPVRENRGTKRR